MFLTRKQPADSRPSKPQGKKVIKGSQYIHSMQTYTNSITHKPVGLPISENYPKNYKNITG
jgi:hypothetical protein